MNSIGLPVEHNSITNLMNITRNDQSNPSLGSFSFQSVLSVPDFYNEGLISSTAYPNPFKNNLTINYTLKKNSDCKIKIYSILGVEIKTLHNNFTPLGNHKITWNGTNNANAKVASGMYFYHIKTDNAVETKAVVFN